MSTEPQPADEPLPAEWFLTGEATESQRLFLDAVQTLGRDFVAGEARDHKVLRYLDTPTLRELFSEPAPHAGCTLDALYALLRDRVAALSVAQHDRRYLAFPDVGNSVAGIAADLLNAFLNQNLITVDCSAPAGTFIEAQLILWLRELVGFPSSSLRDPGTLTALGGMWTPGGNMSNCISVLAALHSRYPTLMRDGLVGLDRRPVILQSREIAHFSYASAAKALGLGERGLMWTRTTERFTTDPAALDEALSNPPDGVDPFMVVAVAGNCRTASLDDLAAIRRVCDRHGVWMHVDACHGGSLLFSQRLRERHLRGIELADSISLDPHKGMFVTYPSSYVLLREPRHLARFARSPEKVSDPDCLDLGLITPFLGSRGFQSLKLWLLLKHLGLSGLSRAVERRRMENERMAALLAETGLFVIFNEQVFYRVALVFCPTRVRKRLLELAEDQAQRPRLRDLVSEFTAAYCNALYRRGEVAFDLAATQDMSNAVGLDAGAKYTVMGMVVGQPEVSRATRAEIRASVLRAGAELEGRMLAALEEGFSTPRPSDPSGPAGW